VQAFVRVLFPLPHDASRGRNGGQEAGISILPCAKRGCHPCADHANGNDILAEVMRLPLPAVCRAGIFVGWTATAEIEKPAIHAIISQHL
jgi:hypothetical protein